MKLINNNETICSIFVDVSKAFDTVNHQIIPQKLYRYGIPTWWNVAALHTEANVYYDAFDPLIVKMIMDQTIFTAGWLRLKCLAHFLVLSGLQQPQNYTKKWRKDIKIIISLQFRLLVFAGHVCTISDSLLIASNIVKSQNPVKHWNMTPRILPLVPICQGGDVLAQRFTFHKFR